MKSIFKSIFLLLIMIVLFAICFEVFLRLFMPQNTCAVVFDNDLKFHRFAPNTHCIWKGCSAEFTVPIAFNKEGYRENIYAKTKPAEITRIAVIGDSYVEAIQVPFDNVFTKQLEAKLNKKEKKFEVIGFGLSGISTEREKIVLERDVLEYNPDIVILAFTLGNDVRDNILVDVDTLKIPEKEIFGIKYEPIKNFLRQNLHIFTFFMDNSRILRSKLSSREANKPVKNIYDYDFEIYREEYSEETINGWKETKLHILDMNNLSHKFMVFIIPTLFQIDKSRYESVIKKNTGSKINTTKPTEFLVDFCNENNITVIDPSGQFKKNNVNNTFYWKYDGHWNEKGHAFAAYVLYQELTNLT